MNRRMKPIYFDYAAQKKRKHDLHQVKRIQFDQDPEMRWEEMKRAESWLRRSIFPHRPQKIFFANIFRRFAARAMIDYLDS